MRHKSVKVVLTYETPERAREALALLHEDERWEHSHQRLAHEHLTMRENIGSELHRLNSNLEDCLAVIDPERLHKSIRWAREHISKIEEAVKCHR